MGLLRIVCVFVRAWVRTQANLAAENLALRQQLAVLHGSVKRPRLRRRDRLCWVVLSRLWKGWQPSLHVVQPATVVKWHRQGFKFYWRWKSRHGKPGRPKLDAEIRDLLRHDRRRVVHFNVTEHPTEQWSAQQMVEAFPYDEAPRYLLRDRDAIYGAQFKQRVKHMGIEEVTITFRSPWQSPYVERLIGSIRRECLDYLIILTEAHLYRILTSYLEYYNESRTHQSLEDNAPVPRIVEPPDEGNVISVPQVGGLHHRYRRAA